MAQFSLPMDPDWLEAFLAKQPSVKLTPSERRIVALRFYGYSDAEIADQLTVTRGAVKRHQFNICQKLDLSSVRQIPIFLIDLLLQRLQSGQTHHQPKDE